MSKKHPIFVLLGIGASLCASSFASAAENAPKPPKLKNHLTFEQADVDLNGGLNLFEFAATQGPGTPMVQVRKRFLLIDTSGATEPVGPDNLVTLEEIQAYRALEVKPESTLTRFELADLDGDGFLSAVEFGYLVSPRVPFKNVTRRFTRMDEDVDGLLSLDEFRAPDDEA
jgi:hypothetical protein